MTHCTEEEEEEQDARSERTNGGQTYNFSFIASQPSALNSEANAFSAAAANRGNSGRFTNELL